MGCFGLEGFSLFFLRNGIEPWSQGWGLCRAELFSLINQKHLNKTRGLGLKALEVPPQWEEVFKNSIFVVRNRGGISRCIPKECLHSHFTCQGDLKGADKNEIKFGKPSHPLQNNLTIHAVNPFIPLCCVDLHQFLFHSWQGGATIAPKFPPFPLEHSDLSRDFRLQEGADLKLARKKLKPLENAILRLLGLE